MALKTIRVKIKSVEQSVGDAISTLAAIRIGGRVRRQRGQYFESLEAVRSVLTEKRLAIVRVVRERRPESVAELARLVGRDFKSVYRDIEILRDLGLINVAETKRGLASRLRTDATEIVVRIAV